MKALPDTSVCSRTEFDDALKDIEKFEESDRELLTRLFVMFDNTGEVSGYATSALSDSCAVSR